MKNKQIIFNTFKITAASVLAILAAFALKLDFYVSAGIIAILSIQPTKKETLKTAAGRFLSFICALIIAYVCFGLFGYNIAAFGIYIFLFVLVCLMLHTNSAMAMDSVLISHFLSAANMEVHMLANEILLFVIGVGFGMLANMHLHKDMETMDELRKDADNQIKKILGRMSEKIVTDDMSDYNGECFKLLWDYIRKAKNMAELNYKNQLKQDDRYDMEYIGMREKQCEILYEMYKNVRRIKTSVIQGQKISKFLHKVSIEYNEDNTVEGLMNDFKELDEGMKNEPLPKTRTEFEDRAQLYALLRLLEEFLLIKKEFANLWI